MTINVQTLNHAPTFTLAANPPAVNEDVGNVTVNTFATNISAGPGDTGQTLAFSLSITGTTGDLSFAAPPLIDPNGKLTYTPTTNSNGTATICAVLTDNGSNVPPNVNTSAAATFTITVNAVNDAPSFIVPANASAVNEDVGSVTVNGFASSISAGPVDESAQTLSFNVSVTGTTGDPTFTSPPAIDATGKLT